VHSARQKYNLFLPHRIQCSKTYGDCEHHIVVVTNHSSWDSDRSRPHVFFSGALHGNERVGPTTLIEVTKYMLSSHAVSPWISYLLNHRVIIMTPMSNAAGYAASRRQEGAIDPNRDFPFLIGDESQCMASIVARTINEIFREYLVQLAITFHGGMRAISYEWGGPNHPTPRDRSPDHVAQHQMAQQMQALGGHLRSQWFYPIGTLNEVVYPVKGGMEDWAYTASWDTASVHSCAPRAYRADGIEKYPAERTVYNEAQLRSFNFLVEASDEKTPRSGWGNLGDSWDTIWAIDDAAFDGHIPRNMRIAMFLINSAQCYVMLREWPQTLTFDVERATFVGDGRTHSVRWSVSGAISVYDYDVMFTLNDGEQPEEWKVLKSRKDPNWRRTLDLAAAGNLKEEEFKFSIEEETKWSVEWMPQIANECIAATNEVVNGERLCPIRLSVRVKVDDQWLENRDLNTGQIIKTYPEGVGPQSHVVNARSMDGEQWNMKNNGYFVKASEWWWADHPVRVEVVLSGDMENAAEVPTERALTSFPSTDRKVYVVAAADDGRSLLVLQIAAFSLFAAAVLAICYLATKDCRAQKQRFHGNRIYERVPVSAPSPSAIISMV